MHQPTRTAGPALPSFGWALSLSVCIHGALLAAWLHARLAEDGAISIGQKRGALTVQLRTMTSAPPRHAPRDDKVAQATMPIPQVRPRPALPAPPTLPEPKPARRDPQVAQSAPSISPAEPPPAQPSLAAEQPGARFANLFAPIVSRPLGHGRWSAQPMNMPVQAQAAMQREQAIQGLRRAIQMRTEALRAELQAQPLSGHCEMRLALERQTARVQCDQEADQQRLMARLGDVVHIQPDMAQGPSDSCLALSERALQWQDCAVTTQP
jgi:hypothetical protein